MRNAVAKKVMIPGVFLVIFLWVTLFSSLGLAGPIDLHSWTAESYPAVSGFGPGNWVVSTDGSTVTQTVNGQPTIFYSDFEAAGSNAIGKICVNTNSDDDFIGFVFGFHPGDTVSMEADYLLVDWKQSTQDYDFGFPSSSPGGTSPRGLAVSRVTGIPDADELWQHANLSGTPTGSGLVELARGNNLGSTGWADYATYEFDFIFTATQFQVFVDGNLELNISGTFNNGRMGFYNFSQQNVVYSSFTVEPVPEPATMLLLGSGLIGLAGFRKKFRSR